jgi:hypothetical protein
MRIRSTILIAAAVVAVAVPALGRADTQTYTGTITVGNPASAVTGGVAETIDFCDPSGSTNGIDGKWFDIGASDATRNATLTTDPTLDGDVYFYDVGCQLIGDFDMATVGPGSPEAGVVPATAEFVVVDGFLGTGAFTLSIDTPPAA